MHDSGFTSSLEGKRGQHGHVNVCPLVTDRGAELLNRSREDVPGCYDSGCPGNSA